MFDGSHRSRRTIDLSGNSGNSRLSSRRKMSNNNHKKNRRINNNNNKETLLETARIQREERRREQRRLDATKRIQRVWRGFIQRTKLVFQYQQQLQLLHPSNSTTNRTYSIVARLFSPSLLPHLTPHGITSLLLQLKKYNPSDAITNPTTTHSDSINTITTTTTTVIENNNNNKENRNQCQFHLVYSRIARNTLTILSWWKQQQQQLEEDKEKRLMALLLDLFVLGCEMNDLVTFLRTKSDGEHEDGVISLFLCWQHYNKDELLCLLSSQVAIDLKQKEDSTFSIFAALSFSSPELFSSTQKQNSLLSHKNLLQSMVHTLINNNDTITTKQQGDSKTLSIMKNLLAGKECRVLSNIILFLEEQKKHTTTSIEESSSSVPVLCVHLLQYLSKQNYSLHLLSALAAHGENLFMNLNTNNNEDNVSIIDLTKEDDNLTNDRMNDDDYDTMNDDDDDYSMDMEMDNTSNHQHNTWSNVNISAVRTNDKKYRFGGSSSKRQDLQTVSKLNKYYKTELYNLRKQIISQLQKLQQQKDDVGLLVHLAMKLGQDKMLQKLGLSILNNTNKDDDVVATYWKMIYDFLPFCSGTNSKQAAMSPFLSNLAFSLPLLEHLWEYIQILFPSSTNRTINRRSGAWKASSLATITVFCDLFSHHLLAVDDEEFLSNFTTTNSNCHHQQHPPSSTPKIIVKQVVVLIRTLLHDLYWARPVLVSDMSSLPLFSSFSSVEDIERYSRARLLLSGTKLWNSLYERWCRLFRTNQFCTEDSWWFPTLVTKNQDEMGAVNNNRSDDGNDDNDYIPMDIDNGDGQNGSSDEDNNNVSRQMTSDTVDNENDALASLFRDPKMARILTSIPQSLPFERRVKLFKSLLDVDKQKVQRESMLHQQQMLQQRLTNDNNAMDEEGFHLSIREQVEIRRDKIYDDSMQKLNPLGKKLRRTVQITFINQHGAHEAGIDGGGVFKEFLDDLIKEAFYPSKSIIYSNNESKHTSLNAKIGALFSESPVQTLAVNVYTLTPSDTVLAHYEFLGRVLGKAVYEGTLVEPQFCLPFLNQLLGKQNTLDDLKNLDPEYYKNLTALRRMESSEIENLGLTFELTLKTGDVSSSPKIVELVPGGSSVAVTKENIIRYIHLVAHRHLNVESSIQTRAFLRGFRDLIPAAWVRLFSAYELQKLIGGDDTIKGIDVQGMQAAMQYSGGYHPSQPIIRSFWEVVEEMTPDQQRKFLKFMTSCSRQPLLGFKALTPLPCIQQLRLREDQMTGAIPRSEIRLPSSSTCMNLLKLPNYKSKEIMKEKLLYAIESGAGFELT